ncbi:MAG: hypothetical protein ACMUHB_07310 [Thermoplasmatota archaeon]
MKMNLPLRDIGSLVFEGGFSSSRVLEEFCVAVGLFNDRRSVGEQEIPGGWDPSRYSIWPLLQVIVHDIDPGIENMEGMRKVLYPYLLGGFEIVRDTVRGSEGTEALKALSELIPP